MTNCGRCGVEIKGDTAATWNRDTGEVWCLRCQPGRARELLELAEDVVPSYLRAEIRQYLAGSATPLAVPEITTLMGSTDAPTDAPDATTQLHDPVGPTFTERVDAFAAARKLAREGLAEAAEAQAALRVPGPPDSILALRNVSLPAEVLAALVVTGTPMEEDAAGTIRKVLDDARAAVRSALRRP